MQQLALHTALCILFNVPKQFFFLPLCACTCAYSQVVPRSYVVPRLFLYCEFSQIGFLTVVRLCMCRLCVWQELTVDCALHNVQQNSDSRQSDTSSSSCTHFSSCSMLDILNQHYHQQHCYWSISPCRYVSIYLRRTARQVTTEVNLPTGFGWILIICVESVMANMNTEHQILARARSVKRWSQHCQASRPNATITVGP